jgi:hypothetical protein
MFFVLVLMFLHLGGVVGGVAVIVAVVLATILFMRRRKSKKVDNERPSIFLDNDDEGPTVQNRDQLPQNYTPEPFTLSEHTDGARTSFGAEARQSLLMSVSGGRSGTPDGATGMSRKSAAPPSLRPANFIVHEDAGTTGIPEDHEEEPETVELPPAYINIRS